MFQVFHANNPTFGHGELPQWPDEFTHVANVDTEQIDEAFMYTNHIDKAWWKNEKVELIQESRSTSVGDIVVDSLGIPYLCEGVGWTMLNDLVN